MPARTNDRPTTIYVRHPPAQGRDWIVSVASTPDQRFSTDSDALRYAMERVRADAVKGIAAEIRLEKEDGTWQTLDPDSLAR
jgi:Uncharacterized protein conserved in bacteria (DUF2188)